MTVKIAAQFTDKSRLLNGLDALEKSLVDEWNDPHAPLRHTAIVTYELAYTKRTVKDHTEQPTIMVRHFEPVFDEAAVTATTLQQQAFSARTGREFQPSLFDTTGDEDE